MSLTVVRHGGSQEKMGFIFSYTGAEGRRDRGREVRRRLSKLIPSDVLQVSNLLKVLHLPKQGPSVQTHEALRDISFLA